MGKETELHRISPRQFLQARRPERFSDSVTEKVRTLDRSILEYHLETLTNRGQETDFERFARRLAEREVCPNLLPHTGPTGGGDSKVDTETYPVADVLADIWYTGLGVEAAAERWAFAFSAKKDWRSKVQSDVPKAVATNRGYRKVFFVTNQYVPDKARAEVEDELRQSHNVDVRILDRSWILDRVFGNHHEELAITELRMAVPAVTHVNKGPLDVQREVDLAQVESRLKAASDESRFDLQTVADAIEAAELARSLERPKNEVDGLFLRAERLANKYGTRHQRLMVAYQQAWTAFFWHEDYDAFIQHYTETEARARGTENIYDLELLTNLWMLLYSRVRAEPGIASSINLADRTATLSAELDRLAAEPDRPSAGLQARTLQLHMRLSESNTENRNAIFEEFKGVVRQSEGLLGYPLEPLVEMLTELGQAFDNLPAYESLFETIVETTAARKGDVTAARMLLRRGLQQLEHSRPYDAIRTLGKCLRKLYKHESRGDLARALYFCGAAYKKVGLLWAARGSMLNAASVAINDLWTYSDVSIAQVASFNRLKWIELQIGRVAHALTWHELERLCSQVLAAQGYSEQTLNSGELDFDAILGILLLRSDTWQLKELILLPDVLERLGLVNAAVALRFALGHTEGLPRELVGDSGDERTIEEFFKQWLDQPAGSEIAARPDLGTMQSTTLWSNILGCRVGVTAQAEPQCVELAESLLAALESVLSTGFAQKVVAREPTLSVNVRSADFADYPFTFDMRYVDGRPHWEVRTRALEGTQRPANHGTQMRARLGDLLGHIIAYSFFIADADVLTALLRDELALERAIGFTGSFETVTNVLGDTPKTSIAAWKLPQSTEYPVRRSVAWSPPQTADVSSSTVGVANAPSMAEEQEVPAGLRDPEGTTHQEIRTVSLIRELLWDKAEWSATAFAWALDEIQPPTLALLFEHTESAAAIFRHWRDELGPVDKQEQLRITIVRGILASNPLAYRVVIGSNPDHAIASGKTKYVVMLSRMHAMMPSSDKNLRGFLDMYAKAGRYYLTYAAKSQRPGGIAIAWDRGIEKRDLFIREAWQIGRHDMDAVGISSDDDPIIPDNQVDVPVRGLMDWKRGRESR